MKYLLLKVLIVTIALLINPEISRGFSVIFDTGIHLYNVKRQVNSEKAKKDYLNIELKPAESKPSANGEKVETVVIQGPVTSLSKSKPICYIEMPYISFSKKASSLASYQYGFFSGLTDKSPLIILLRN